MNCVYYHSPCLDGFTAAWIANKHLGMGSYIGINYGTLPERVDYESRNVWILDFSLEPDVLGEVCEGAKSVILLDHHATAIRKLDGWTHPKATIILDDSRSGAQLAADWWGEGQNWLVDYVSDRDLWRFALKNSREISAALGSYPMSFDNWDMIYAMGVDPLVVEGRGIERYKSRLIERILKGKRNRVIGGFLIPTVNSPILESELGEALSMDSIERCGGVWYENGDGDIKYSLRSLPDGLDVSKIAESYGGGGHKHAAGFINSMNHEP